MLNLLGGLKEKALKYIQTDDERSETIKDEKIKDEKNEGENKSDYSDLLNSLNKASDIFKSVFKDTTNVLKTNIEDNRFLNELDDMQKTFEEENKKDLVEDETELWSGHPKENVLKKQILALSQDSRNFLRNPPEGCDFIFEMKQYIPYAKYMLKQDPKLAIMRFRLVPTKVKEETFWHNYFYRVSLIKHSMNLYDDISDTPSKIQENIGLNNDKNLPMNIEKNDLGDDEDDGSSSVPIEFISDNLVDYNNDSTNGNQLEKSKDPLTKLKKEKSDQDHKKPNDIKSVCAGSNNESPNTVDEEEEIEKMLELKEYEMIKSDTVSDEWDDELQEMLENQKI